MISYDPGKWSISFAFSLHGSVFPKAIAWALPCSMLAVVLHIIFHMHESIMEKVGAGDIAASVLGGFTFILGFLVVFRSQQAYSRWWEGGTLLQQLRGEWFNSYSCLLAFCSADADKQADVKNLQHQLVRLYSLLYGCALQQVSTQQVAAFELVALEGFDEASLDFLSQSPDRCEVVLQWIQRLIVESNQREVLKIAPPILSRVFNELGNGIVNLNNARKITEFPIPFPLAQMITVMLLFHAGVTPVICAATVQTSYWAGLISFVVTFSYWTINYIAVELEMPFGEDLNDLPLQLMQEDMNGSLCTLIDDRAQKVPAFELDLEMHDQLRTKVVDFNKDITTETTRSALPPTRESRRSKCDTKCVAQSPGVHNSPNIEHLKADRVSIKVNGDVNQHAVPPEKPLGFHAREPANSAEPASCIPSVSCSASLEVTSPLACEPNIDTKGAAAAALNLVNGLTQQLQDTVDTLQQSTSAECANAGEGLNCVAALPEVTFIENDLLEPVRPGKQLWGTVAVSSLPSISELDEASRSLYQHNTGDGPSLADELLSGELPPSIVKRDVTTTKPSVPTALRDMRHSCCCMMGTSRSGAGKGADRPEQVGDVAAVANSYRRC